MKLLAGAGLLALAGCAAAPAPDGAIYRDTGAPISSQVDVTAARLAGAWYVRVGPVVGPVAAGDALRLAALAPAGPGRFEVTQGALKGRVLWVLWLDADNRTAAIGSPDGQLGWVMDRAARGGADRIRAAREIMEWQGYDLSRMKEVGG
jgi:apolipoprotein D and lipocalin family protein